MLKEKNNKIILLNCIKLPAKNFELNLNYINELKKFCPIVGYSDHSNSNLDIISVSKGAKVIEKHFMLSKKKKVLIVLFHVIQRNSNPLLHILGE